MTQELWILLSLLLLPLGVGILWLGRLIRNQYREREQLARQVERLQASLESLEQRLRDETRQNRQELSERLAQFQTAILGTLQNQSDQQNQQARNGAEAQLRVLALFQKSLEERFDTLRLLQQELAKQIEKRLDQIRETVDEKLQKTLDERLGQSFASVSRHLQSVQEGLGEMRTLAQDVGGLKKVLSNVKVRGGLGEVQLAMLLEQILAPDQFETNVRTKAGSADVVEFAIKLPGRDEQQSSVYLPIDAKFPREVYERVVDAYETADPAQIEAASKNLDQVIRKMARDIRDKYIDPPATTDFGILFLPFESIYAEVVRRSALLEQLQRNEKVIVTGPSTLAAILNSLQMGFKTLAIQRRSSEVWNLLKAVKTEFGEFSRVLSKAQEKILGANEELDKLVGVRTRQINRKLREVELLRPDDARKLLESGADSLPDSGTEEETES